MAHKKTVYDIYYEWLMSQVMYKDMKRAGRDYSLLLECLHKAQFVPLLDKDRNRLDDGKYLRFIFGTESAYWDEIKGGCTFLEMLIGISIRINDDIFEIDDSASPARWFWMMMENCGLDKYTNDAWNEVEVVDKIGDIINRCYEFDGNGGLFPLKNPKEDQRNVEIWYQMQSYILENFRF